MPDTYLFAGPTAYALSPGLFEKAGLIRCAPVQRGGVLRLVEAAPVAQIAIVDGRFGDVMAVGHREILAALDGGWRVWGVGSIGAVRAAELAGDGMIGYGAVYNHFLRTDAPDDEVAVMHGPAPEYRPATEALVDLRSLLAHLVQVGALGDGAAASVAATLAGAWFGDRSLPAFVGLCGQAGGPAAAAAARDVADSVHRYRVKSRDLRDFLEEGPWRRTS